MLPASTTTDLAEATVRALLAEIDRQFDAGVERLDWRPLRRLAGLGQRQINRLFREHTGTTPTRYLAERRARLAETYLAQGHDVLSAAVGAGYSGPGRLHEAMVARRGVTPGEYRARGAGVVICHGTFRTPVGHALVAATDRGLCALRLCTHHTPAEHLAEITTEFPAAEFHEDPAAVQPYADQLVAFLEHRAADFRPRIDVLGTPFQRLVWEELCCLRPGETISYGELARRLGRPTATRAVAHACARNGIAIAIPCHRVVQADGQLRGYRWGLDCKKWLLERGR